jgi:hypothetical protein
MTYPILALKRKHDLLGAVDSKKKRSSEEVLLSKKNSSSIASATIKVNDTPCGTATLPTSYSLSDDDVLELDYDMKSLDYVNMVGSVQPQDVTYFRRLLLGSVKRPQGKNLLTPVPVNMRELSVIDHIDLLLSVDRPLYLTCFPNNNVATTGLRDLFTMAESLESVDINLTQPITLDTDLSSIAVPWRTGVSHEAMTNLKNSYNENVIDSKAKFANDELFDVNTLYRMVGAKFSENIFIMPSHLVPSYRTFKEESDRSGPSSARQVKKFV